MGERQEESWWLPHLFDPGRRDEQRGRRRPIERDQHGRLDTPDKRYTEPRSLVSYWRNFRLPDRILRRPFGLGVVAALLALAGATMTQMPQIHAQAGQARNPNPADRNTEAGSDNPDRADGDATGAGMSWLAAAVRGAIVLVALGFGAALWQRRRHSGAY